MVNDLLAYYSGDKPGGTPGEFPYPVSRVQTSLLLHIANAFVALLLVGERWNMGRHGWLVCGLRASYILTC